MAEELSEFMAAEAVELFEKTESDRQAFSYFMNQEALELASIRKGRKIDLELAKEYFGHDQTVPDGYETLCACELANAIIKIAKERHPDDELLQYLISRYESLDELFEKYEERQNWTRNDYEKFYEDARRIHGELAKSASKWPAVVIKEAQDKLLAIKQEILSDEIKKKEFAIIPRFFVQIYMRENDEKRGDIIYRNGRRKIAGCFVTVCVGDQIRMDKIPFALGLEAGWHILAACSIDCKELKNICFNLREDTDRKTGSKIRVWDYLPSQIYSEALERKTYFESQKKVVVKRDDEWVEGKELEAELYGERDRNFRYTVRGLSLRRNMITNEWEIFFVGERGDPNGKPPGIGCPGGTVEDEEIFGATLCRETENEGQCRRVIKVIARVAKIPKKRLPNHNEDNIDRWYLLLLDSEAGLSKKLVESNEIFFVRWFPLSELAGFSFQNSKRPEKNLRNIEEKRIMYFSQAANLSIILPRIEMLGKIPGFKLPDNFSKFQENIQMFNERNAR